LNIGLPHYSPRGIEYGDLLASVVSNVGLHQMHCFTVATHNLKIDAPLSFNPQNKSPLHGRCYLWMPSPSTYSFPMLSVLHNAMYVPN
jgi:hypothetical protein